MEHVLIYMIDKVEVMRRLQRTENWMMRWICGVQLKNRVKIEKLLKRLEIEGMGEDEPQD